MSGKVEDGVIQFEARLQVNPEGGTLAARDGKIIVTAADSATLILAGSTNFKNYEDVSADPRERNQTTFSTLHGKSFDALRAQHIADYQSLFRRVSLDLGSTPAASLPTAERIALFAKANDPALVALLFQYGRYLMIASSRPGGQPANLQGLWNESNNPPWDSKYTDNINTEMNYWPVEETALPECQLPLFDALQDLSASGGRTASSITAPTAGCSTTISTCGAAPPPSTPPTTASGRPAARGSPPTFGSITCSLATANSCATPPTRL